jgi:hypothetical protein
MSLTDNLTHNLNLFIERHPVATIALVTIFAVFVTAQVWSIGYTFGKDLALNGHSESRSK